MQLLIQLRQVVAGQIWPALQQTAMPLLPRDHFDLLASLSLLF